MFAITRKIVYKWVVLSDFSEKDSRARDRFLYSFGTWRESGKESFIFEILCEKFVRSNFLDLGVGSQESTKIKRRLSLSLYVESFGRRWGIKKVRFLATFECADIIEQKVEIFSMFLTIIHWTVSMHVYYLNGERDRGWKCLVV